MLRAVVGHPGLVRLLARLVGRDRLPHALILEGPAQCGRRTVARALAMALLCPERIDGDACGVCAHCRQSAAGTHPDLSILPNGREAPGGIPVDDLREVAERAYTSPLLSVGKAIILPDAERLRDAAANALLKVLEEPPPRTTLILTATSAAGLLGTIRSRSQVFRMSALSPADAARLLTRAGPQPQPPAAPLDELRRIIASPDLAAVAQVCARIESALDEKRRRKEAEEADGAEAEDDLAELTPAAAQRMLLRAWLLALAGALRLDLRDRDPVVAGVAVERLERVHRALSDLDRNQSPRFVLESLAVGK